MKTQSNATLAQRIRSLPADKRELLERRMKDLDPAVARAAVLGRSPDRDSYPLSFAQERLWFLHQLEPESSAYHIFASHRLAGPLDVPAMARAWDEIVRRHDVLRTRFTSVGDEARQVVEPPRPLPLPVVDLRALAEGTVRELVPELSAECCRRPFDLTRAPLMRVVLVRRGAEDHVFLLTLHHIVADGWSLGILLRELLALYDGFVAGRAASLPEVVVRYGEFAHWQRQWLTGEVLAELLEFWRRQLEGAPPVVELPGDRPRPAVQSYRGAVRRSRLGADLSAALRGLSRGQGTTLFMTLLAVYGVLLRRYCGQEDLTVGTPMAGRSRVELEPVVGLFVNTLVLRLDLAAGETPDPSSAGPTFRDLLARLRPVLLAAKEHESMPFERLVHELHPQRSLSYSPLFQVWFALQNTPGPEAEVLRVGDLTLSPEATRNDAAARFDLALDVVASGGDLECLLEYSTDLVDATTAERMLRHFRVLAEAVVADPERGLMELPLISPAERRQLVGEWSDTATPVPDACLHELIAAQAARTPEAVAVVFEGSELSYRELGRESDQLAAWLIRHGVAAESLVGIALEPGPQLVVALLAVLKAGGAYLPLDPSYPRERLAYMVEDAGTAVVITQQDLLSLLPEGRWPTVCLDRDQEAIAASGGGPPAMRAEPEALAYVIYTSGSTGKPKGVGISHRALVNFLESMRRRPGLTAEDRWLAVTPLSFDISGLELWLPLLAGATVEPVSRRTAADGELLRARLAEVTILQATPSTWHLLLATGWTGSRNLKALCGGEALSPQLATELTARAAETWNMYGPTETTIWSAVERVEAGRVGPGAAVAIGRPIANTAFHVVDARLSPQPVGVPGELLIGGAGLARGYPGRPALTARSFLPDPFATVPGERLYRTGDLVRWLRDGGVEYLGRLDTQVKLRGFRIELGEIESVLGAHPAVAAAVVVERGAAAEARLVAYVVPAAAAAEEAELRRHLRAALPEYMVPSAFVILEALPLLPNGKVDRRALPEPEARPEREPAAMPASELEEALAGVWREVLGVEKVGLFDNFFDAGGHSLLLVQVRARVRELVGRDVALVDFFRFPTIRALADHLGRGRPAERVAPALVSAVRPRRGEIAIIGLSCRFAKAPNVEQFWQNLCNGVEAVRFLSEEELIAGGIEPGQYTHPNYVRASVEVDEPDYFDAALFGYSPSEAEVLDPQQRVFLECAWHALESAGYDPARFPGRVGVFAGAGMGRYAAHVYSHPDIVMGMGAQALLFSVANDYLATRVAYKLNLIGPAVVIQSACSTSLVATHLARQALLEGECDMALSGGVSVQNFVPIGYQYAEGGMVSPDGHCRAFDARAKGTVFASGLGVVVLKRLPDALAAGDNVMAVIKGSAINNDGALKIGYTAPSVEGQMRVIRAAQENAGVDPETITYVEAHGTGTALGDPIEVEGLTRAFGTEKRGFCALGSVKTNVGHTDSAAGVAALIKATLAVREGLLPPSLNFEQPNPEIDFAHSPFYVQTELGRWEPKGVPRRAGVSAFGVGGTNAHAVLEQAPEVEPSGPSRRWQLLLLSARTENGLEVVTDNLARHLAEHPDQSLADVAFTLQVGRAVLAQRRMLVTTDADDAIRALEARERKRVLTGTFKEGQGAPPVVFLFPGQGAQYAGMGSELYEAEPAYRAEVDRCCELLEPHLTFDSGSGLDLRRLLHAPPEEREAADAELRETRLTQPALFVVEYALARLWMAWGIHPEAMLGHSIGEYVAACLAGVFTLPEALRLVAARGRLMQETPPGAMLTIALPEDKVVPLLGQELSLAAANSPTVSVVSGPGAALDALEQKLTAQQVKARRLRTSHAFHSALMEPVLDRFAEEVARVNLRPPRIPYLSNLTGTWIADGEATDPGYWVRHLRNAVRFAAGAQELLSKPERVLLEVGPGRTLQTLVRQQPEGRGAQVFSSFDRPREKKHQPEPEHLLGTLGQLWLGGVDVDWTGFYAGERRLRVVLPSYPFARQRYWIDISDQMSFAGAVRVGKKEDLAEWFYVPFWKPSVAPPAAEDGDGDGGWLLLVDECGLGSEMARQLQAAGETVVTAQVGEAFSELGPGRYALRPGERADHEALFGRLGTVPQRIVHLWTVTSEAPVEPVDGRMVELAFYSLLSHVQALALQGGQTTVELAVVSTGVQTIDGREAVWPEKAALLGPCKVIPQEYPNLRTRAVDVQLDGAEPAELAAQLIAETQGESADRIVAYRGPNRWAQSFEPAPLGPPVDEKLPLRPQGTYLITGGLGGLGLCFARYLAESFQARLVLTQRSPVPPRDQWADDKSVKIRELRALEELGAEVLVEQADAADEDAMRRVVAAARERFGQLHGVIHAAGIAGGGVIQLKERETAAAVLEPKVRGVRVLESVLGEEPLDFLLLCSSITALEETVGQVDYCAANNVLDAFARYFRARRPQTRTVSVNWGAWSEVGMAVEAARTWDASQPGAEKEPPGEEVDHPFLQRLVTRGEQAVFVAHLRSHELWVLFDHRILGRLTMPGAAYLEFARAAVARHSGSPEMELADILFLMPMAMDDVEEREVRTVLDPSDEGFVFRVMSRLPGGEEQWVEHVRGRATPLAAAEPRRWDLAEISARCTTDVVPERTRGETSGDFLASFGARWDLALEIRRDTDEALAWLELREEFVADCDVMHLHPALLDVATSFGRGLAEWTDYLPAAYHRVEYRRPLPPRFCAYVRPHGTLGKGEVISFDVVLIDEDGVELVAIEEFSMKRVGEAADRFAQPIEVTTAPGIEPPSSADRTLATTGIAPGEGVEALRRILSRHPGPQIAAVAGDVALFPAPRRPGRGQEAPGAAPPPVERPRHERPAIATDFVAPRNELEKRVAEIWQDLLGIDQIGIHDEFIALGGHSLLAMQTYSRLQESLGITLSPAAVFEAETVAELAEVIAEAAPQPQPAVAAIPPVDRDRELPLSFGQERLWFLAELEPTSAAYNLSLALRFEGPAEIPILARTLDWIVDRHEALRTTFVEGSAGPVQVIGPPRSVPIALADLSAVGAEGDAEAQRLLQQEAGRPFDLSRDLLLRVLLVRLAPTEHLMLVVMHHIACDYWSWIVFLRELQDLYGAWTSGAEAPELEPLPVQYADFATWQRQWLTGPVLDEQIAYWRDRLAPEPPVFELPTDRPRPPLETFAGARHWIGLDLELNGRVEAVSRELGVTVFTTLLAAFWTLLHRYTGEDDLIIGSPVGGRTRSEVEGLIGVFINNLALRIGFDGNAADREFRELMQRTREVSLGAFGHQELPFEQLVDALRLERDLSRAPIFQVMFILHNVAVEGSSAELSEVNLNVLPVDTGAAVYDLTLALNEMGETRRGWIEYKSDLFDGATIARMAGHFLALLRGAVAAPEARLAELPLLAAPEHHQLLAEWNDAGTALPTDRCLHELVADQVERTPDSVAVVFAQTTLNYRELDRQSDLVASWLARQGVAAESLVGIALDPAPELVVALLGVLRAGAAYLPLDPSYPRERLAYMVEDSGAEVLLTREHLRALLPEFAGAVLCLDDGWQDQGVARAEVPLSLRAHPESLAYVIYTSGSTGRPKGVQISHRALVNFLGSMRQRPGLGAGDRLLSVTPLSFDISGLELWLPLLVGATVELVGRETAADGELLRERLAEATMMQATPATWRLLLAAEWSGSANLKALCGGEALDPQLAGELAARSGATWNMYGPTETTIWSSLQPLAAGLVGEGPAAPIGRPIANTSLYVVAPGLERPQPQGVAGELLIGGAGLARGYLGRPALTAERFVPDPFIGQAGARLYRTGDLARWRADGTMEFLGRLDHQIKLRGFRIELGEIESVLARHPAVAAAVVVLRGAAEAARLVAYVVPAGGPEPQADELRRHLREGVPEYMVPAAFVVLEALPLLPNGKVDRRSLPDPAARPEAEIAYEPPTTELEQAVAGIWQEVLGVGKVGLFDNFFDVGGHSLLLAQVRSRLRELLGRDVPLMDLFRFPNIRALVDHLLGAETRRLAPAARRVVKPGSELAIVGMSCRFAGAESVEEFWHNLCAGVESIRQLSDEELAAAGVPASLFNAPNYVRASADLKDPDHFDAAFFGFNPREAKTLDPQHRVFLECAWQALESAGYDPARYPGRIGVYAGAAMSRYAVNLFSDPESLAIGPQNLSFSVAGDYFATRVAYKLNLTGPAVVVQSACSTSLVAAHLARQALVEGECDMALAGGVAIQNFTPQGYTYLEGDMNSPDGHCRAFDARAQGTVFGSGVGVVVLKRLADAIADGDHVRAVIKGSAINNDGSSKVGYTAPSIEGQLEVIRAAQAAAGVDPESISYVETHGTGTALGDPIEVEALTRAFATEKTEFCALGSVKTNVGHTDIAAGVAALIKTALVVEEGLVPPSLNFEEPNPKIDFAATPFYVQAELERWETDGAPRRAGVSSFGIGGTNAHAILEQAPEVAPSGPSRPWQLLVLSARSEGALEAMTDNLASHLRERSELPLADVAFTLQQGRAAFHHRRTLVCRDPEEAAEALAGRERKRVLSGTVDRDQGPPPVVFLFPGQGAQYAGMGRELYDSEPVFRTEIDRCCELLEPLLGQDLREVLHPAPEKREEADEMLRQTRLTQPALYVVEYALARLWMEWGIRPEAMLGHSIGEYVAATLAGVLTLPEALRLVAARGRLMQETSPGAMLSVPLPEAEVRPLLTGELTLAAANSPTLCVVSGPPAAIETLRRQLADRSLDARLLRTSHAFHSALMEPILDRFREEVAGVALKPPQIPYLSNLTGTWIRAEEATDPGFWVRHLRSTVRFSAGLGELFARPERILLEVGPGRTLQTLVRQHPEGKAAPVVSSLGRPRGPEAEAELILRALGSLWLAGVSVDWTGFYAHERRLRVALPTYPFERRRYWIEPGGAFLASPALAGRKEDLSEWFYQPIWKISGRPAPFAPAEEDRRWLLFVDDCGVGAELARQLAAAECEVVAVEPGEAFAQLGTGRYAVRPGEGPDYDALFAALGGAGGVPRRIVHLWTVTAGGAAQEGERCEQMLERGFYSLLCLAQGLGRLNLTATVRLGIVSTAIHRVDGREELWPEKAAILGPARVIPREYPNLRASAIDVVVNGSGAVAGLARQLLAELAGELPDPVVAYRGRSRRVQTFEPVALAEGIDQELPWRRQGAYLITGGLGGLGLVFARYLAAGFQARLVLTGRSPFPAREEWDAWLTEHGGADPTSERIGQLRALEQAGAELLVVAADVTDEAAMRGVLDLARERFGELHGVIHAAGVPGGGVIQRKMREVAAGVLAAKVQGTRALVAALEDSSPDVLVLCSSITSILGVFGQVDYCAANAVLDAFAHDLRARRPETFAVAVNWGRWEEVGMAAAAAGTERASLPPGTPVAHPLLDRCLTATPERAEFATELRADDHWVLSEHLIVGTPTVPGATYVEIARAAFEHLTGELGCALSEIVFLSPLMVDRGESREVRTRLERRGEGFEFRVLSRVGSGGEDGWQEHALGKVAPLGDEAEPRHDLAAITARCASGGIAPAGDAPAVSDHLVTAGPRWQSLREASFGNGEGLARLELADELAGDLDEYVLHPALLDVATGLCRGLAEHKDYLPFSYHQVRVRRPMTGTLWSYTRLRGEERASRETLTVDVTLLDETGAELAAIDRFTMKRVGDAADQLRRRAPAAARPAVGPGITPQGAGIRPDEGVEALRRLLSRYSEPQIVVSPEDLPALIAQLGAPAAEQEPPVRREAHERPAIRASYLAPRTELEQRLAEIWQELLGIDKVGVEDDFLELGGHSLLATQMYSRLQALGIEVSLPAIFDVQTIAQLAALIEQAERETLVEDVTAVVTSGDQEDLGELEKLFGELEEMSVEEAEAALRELRPGDPEEGGP